MESVGKRFTLVGVGPGSEQYLTLAARRAVEQARILTGAQRLLDLFAHASASRLVFSGSIESWLDQLSQCAEALGEGSIVVLVSGDPGVSSLAANVLWRFGRHQCRTIAGISSVQLACAALGLGWDHAAIVVAHGSLPEQLPSETDPRDPWILLMGAHGAESLAARLASQTGRTAYRCEDLSLPSERIAQVSIEELAELPTHPRRIVVLTREQLDV